MTQTTQPEQKSHYSPERVGTRASLHEVLGSRRSPRAFSDRPLAAGEIISLFEAARWSPSSVNEQPWNFIAAAKSDTKAYALIADALSERNRRWAIQAPLLIVGIAQSTYLKSGTPYNHAWFDLGQSVANLTVQATAMGLSVHPMGGFDAGQIKKSFSVPDGYDAVIILAVGHAERPETLPDDLRSREEAPRMRKPLESFVFTDTWGQTSHHVSLEGFSLNSQSSN